MILIKNLQTIVTQNSARRIINNGAILVEGEKIVEVGESRALEKKYAKAEQIIDGQGQVAIPGLINAHTHAAMNLLRGIADDMPLKEWLETKIWPAEERLTPVDIYRGTKDACEEMLVGGTTTFNNMYWQPQEEIKAINQSNLRGWDSITVIDIGPLNIKPAFIEKTYNEIKGKAGKRVKITLAPHAVYSVTEETWRWCKQFADANGLLLHIHLSETEEEVKNCIKQHGGRPVEYLDKMGILTLSNPSLRKGGGVIAAHGCWLDDEEIKILAKRGVSVAHCPVSNLKLVSGVMPLSKLIKAGVNVCLGTDGSSSNNNLDMLEEMKVAALIHKWNERNTAAADAQTILDMATLNGARALKMEQEIGSIDIGKQADIVLSDFTRPHLRPSHNVVSNLVYSAQGGDVALVLVGGRVLYQR